MMTLEETPKISELKIENNQADFRVYLPENLLVFQGHFPQEPILPGVAQIHWSIKWGLQFFNIRNGFLGMEQIKFHMPAKPGDHLNGFLYWNPEKSQLFFRYTLAGKVVSSGRIRIG
jgi:3-hydroxymyristoyl/3-hydroxydecanoyl-(acyl carrier protein) dehydratase